MPSAGLLCNHPGTAPPVFLIKLPAFCKSFSIDLAVLYDAGLAGSAGFHNDE
jgi:hypothetical protein